MLQICPKLPGQKYKDPLFEEEIISFIRDLGHTGETKTIVSGAEPPKANTKYKKKPDEPVTPSKSKSAPAAKGLAVQYKVALTKAKQIKLATKRSKKDFHMAHTSGSCDGVDIQSKVSDEQQQKTFSQDDKDDVEESYMNDDSEETESNNDGDDLTHPNLSTYKVDDEEEEEEKADDDEVSSDQSVYTPPDHQLTDEERNQKGNDEVKEGEEEQDGEEELYRDLNINLQRTVQQQSSSVSSDLVSKFINPSPDIGIDLILNPNIQSQTLDNVPVFVAAETPSSDTTIPQPPIPNIQPLQQTPDSTTTTTIPIMTFPDIPNFASLFQFDQRVDSTMKTIIKEQVHAQVSKIMPKIEKGKKSKNKSDIQKNLYNTLVESYNSDKDIITSYGDVVTLKRGRDDQDKDEDPSAGSNRGSKRRRSGKEAESSKQPTHKESKSTSSSKGATRSQPKSSGKSTHAEEHGQRVDDLEDQSHQERTVCSECGFKNVHSTDYHSRMCGRSEIRNRKLPEEDKPQEARPIPNRLMRTDELHKFNDDTLNHVRTALNDISTGIEMYYLTKQKWSKKDKQRARVMINAIDRKLRDRRLMRNLEKFVGERPYGGDLWLLERTI
uniref:Uncharacterized protein n=1 Tax=Tanacetum cinerariifolium TaxID=118510 RepID=A0A6L2JAG6_TANCI|nr:hypothetical protein [Tanacetum cinerariifolium]